MANRHDEEGVGALWVTYPAPLFWAYGLRTTEFGVGTAAGAAAAVALAAAAAASLRVALAAALAAAMVVPAGLPT